MQFIIDGLQVSGILNFRIIADAEEATDISSDSIMLPEVQGVTGDKSGGLLEAVGDESGGLYTSIDLAGCTVIGVVGVEDFLFT